jgi:hypothetical protein
VARAAAPGAGEAGLPEGAGGFDPAAEPPRFRVMLLGDSTANSLGWGLRGVRQPGLAVELLGQDGCTMLADMCGGDLWTQRTRELRPNATLVFLGGAFLHGLSIDGEWRKSCHPGWDARFERYLGQRLGEIVVPPTRVWAVTLPYPLDVYDTAAFRAEVDCINASIRRTAAAVPGVLVLELGERLCPRGVCQRESDGVEIRPDGVHYTVPGSNALARWVLAEVQR